MYIRVYRFYIGEIPVKMVRCLLNTTLRRFIVKVDELVYE